MQMLRMTVEDALVNLKDLLNELAEGQQVVLIENDQEIARLVPSINRVRLIENTRAFRRSLQKSGESLSSTVIRERDEECRFLTTRSEFY